jgi:hypothetical protein
MAGNANTVMIDPPTPEARRLWAKALELAEAFGATNEWALVGGLMVQLHAYEHQTDSRPTTDIDVLGDSRQRPSMTQRIAEILKSRGGTMAMPPRSNRDLGYQFEIDGDLVEVLGSEGVKGNPKTVGNFTTFQVPGGSQALWRTEIIQVSLDGQAAVALRRPNLLGAILIKARVVAKKRRGKFESDRQDSILLLSLIPDPRALATDGGLKKTEKKWLRNIEKNLNFSDPTLTNLFPSEALARAEQAYRLLISPRSS